MIPAGLLSRSVFNNVSQRVNHIILVSVMIGGKISLLELTIALQCFFPRSHKYYVVVLFFQNS
jgi:hypothetical protein